jgi:hypothetical protein
MHAVGRRRGRLGQQLYQWKRKARGLSRAGLGSGNQVTPRQGGGNRLGLDRGGGMVAQFVESLQQRLDQAKILEAHRITIVISQPKKSPDGSGLSLPPVEGGLPGRVPYQRPPPPPPP